MGNENSFRDKVKDAIVGCGLYDSKISDESENYEIAGEIADAVFNALGINEHQQDLLSKEHTIKIYPNSLIS